MERLISLSGTSSTKVNFAVDEAFEMPLTHIFAGQWRNRDQILGSFSLLMAG